MSALALRVLDWCPPCPRDADFYTRLRAAFADGPVAENMEAVAAEPVVSLTPTQRHDLDAMLHARETTPRG